MKNNITELVFVMDKSGSMSGLEKDVIGGFNSMLEKQKKQEGTVYVTTVLFSHESRTLHDRVSIDKVSPVTDGDYVPGGSTALLDALGDTIRHIANIHRYARPEDVPEHTIFVITTDGMENSSRRYTAERVREMIRHEEQKYGWEFLFLAANIDAVETAEHIGIRAEHAANYAPTSSGTTRLYACVDQAVSNVRACRGLTRSWSDGLIDGDSD